MLHPVQRGLIVTRTHEKNRLHTLPQECSGKLVSLLLSL